MNLEQVTTNQQFDQIYMPLEKYNTGKQDGEQICTFYFIRHGESTANAKKQNAGATLDVDLTDEGVDQAKIAGSYLAERVSNFSAVYCSKLKRTHQTKEAINETWKEATKTSLPEQIIREEFNEKHYGGLELTQKPKNAEAAKEIEEAKAKKQSDKSKPKPFHERYVYKAISDQESIQDVYNRVTNALNEIAPNHLGKNVLVVTHFALMRAVMESSVAFSENPRDLDSHQISIANTGILVLESDGKQCHPKAINGIVFKSL